MTGEEPSEAESPGERGGADQSAAVVDPERFARQLRITAIAVVVFAVLATLGAVLAVSVFH